MRFRRNIFSKAYLPNQKNKILFLLMSVSFTISVGLTSDNYVQAFLIKSGVSSVGIGVYGSLMQIFAMVAYFFLLNISPKAKGFKKKYLWASLLLCIFPICLIVSRLVSSIAFVTLAIATLGGILFSILLAYKNTCEYSMVSYLFEPEYYGVMLGKSGVYGGLLAFFITGTLSGILGRLGFPKGYFLIFILAALMFLISALFIIKLRLNIPNVIDSPPKPKSTLSLLKLMATKKHFAKLFPHFLRGIGSSGIYFFMTVAMSRIELVESQIATAIAIGVAATTAANLLFTFMIRHICISKIIWYANLMCGICMVAVSINSNLLAFYLLYGVMMFFNAISQVSIPTGVLKSTKTEDMPAISAMRMLLTSAASSIFTLLYGGIIKETPPIFIMLFAAIVFIICGGCFKSQFSEEA